MHSAHGAVYFQNLLSSQNFEKLSHLSPPLSSSESLSFISKCEMAKTILFSSNNNDLIFCFIMYFVWGFPCGSAGKESTCHAGDPGSIPGSGRSPGEGIGYPLQYSWALLVAQMVKNLPAMRETWVRSLGWEDPLEEGMATHSSILAWRIQWTEEPGRLQSTGSHRVRHN